LGFFVSMPPRSLAIEIGKPAIDRADAGGPHGAFEREVLLGSDRAYCGLGALACELARPRTAEMIWEAEERFGRQQDRSAQRLFLGHRGLGLPSAICAAPAGGRRTAMNS